jgi:hypothetical protein
MRKENALCHRVVAVIGLAAILAVGGPSCSGETPSTGSDSGGSGGNGAAGATGATGGTGATSGTGATGGTGGASSGGAAGATNGGAAGTGTAGSSSTGGNGGRGGSAGSAGAGGIAGGADGSVADGAVADGTVGTDAERPDLGGAGDGGGNSADVGCVGSDAGTTRFSFFVTSLAGMRRLSGSQNGFGGDLRFGQSDGIAGADEICRQLAESSLPGASCKTWRAFLSATKDATGTPVHAIDRVGTGPWYDRLGRLVAMTKDDLLQPWPRGADPAIIYDLPNEFGVPNHNPDGTGNVDNHNTLTGSGADGKVIGTDWALTCHDWTTKVGTDGTPRIGFSWRGGAATFPGSAWYTGTINEAGCADYINLTDSFDTAKRGVGSLGGYGGFYCLARTP